MTRFAAWTVSLAFLVGGLACALGAVSLTHPATNPVSNAAGRFKASVFQGTALGVLLLFLAEVAARRWSAPAGGWRWAWLLIGAFFLLLGVPLLVAALRDATPLGVRIQSFRLGLGALWLALGIASCAIPLVRRRPRAPV